MLVSRFWPLLPGREKIWPSSASWISTRPSWPAIAAGVTHVTTSRVRLCTRPNASIGASVHAFSSEHTHRQRAVSIGSVYEMPVPASRLACETAEYGGGMHLYHALFGWVQRISASEIVTCTSSPGQLGPAKGRMPSDCAAEWQISCRPSPSPTVSTSPVNVRTSMVCTPSPIFEHGR